MDGPAIYVELKAWQGAIGSLLGFGALILGALFNFHLNRKRDEQLRGEEVIAITAAIYSEIIIIRRSLARMANAVGGRYLSMGLREDTFDEHFLKGIALPELRLYPALASKVGVLPSNLAFEIVSFYSRAEEAQTWLTRLREDETRPYSYGVNYVLDPALEAVNGVLSALRIMEKTAVILDQAGPLDLKRAVSAQSFEREQNEN